MNGGSWVLRAGEYLVGRAARYLPPSVRGQRHQEWSAELPVILDDPSVRPPARRAARMLWFAADTLRGAAVARLTPRGRHVSPDAPANHPFARWVGALLALLGILLAILLGIPVLFGLWGYLIYAQVTGATLTSDVVYPVAVLASVLISAAVRQRLSWRNYGVNGCLMVVGTGQLLHDLARHFGWGHPLFFLIIAYIGQAALSLALGSSLGILVSAARARFRKAQA